MVNFNNVASHMYAQDLDNCINSISLLGDKITFVLQGDMGNGKSATLTTLGEKFTTTAILLRLYYQRRGRSHATYVLGTRSKRSVRQVRD